MYLSIYLYIYIYIYIYILVLIISLGWLNCRKTHGPRWGFVNTLCPNGIFPPGICVPLGRKAPSASKVSCFTVQIRVSNHPP